MGRESESNHILECLYNECHYCDTRMPIGVDMKQHTKICSQTIKCPYCQQFVITQHFKRHTKFSIHFCFAFVFYFFLGFWGFCFLKRERERWSVREKERER